MKWHKLTDEKHEALKQALSELKCDTSSLDVSSIQKFLNATEDVKLPAANRLLWLGANLPGEYDWGCKSRIYQYLFDLEPSSTVLMLWANDGISRCIGDDHASDLDERTRIFNDCTSIIERAIGSSPGNPGLLTELGRVYFLHPLRQANPDYLIKALKLFENAIELAKDCEDELVHAVAELYAGDCYFEMKRYAEALSHYSLVDADQIDIELGGSAKSNLADRIQVCRQS